LLVSFAAVETAFIDGKEHIAEPAEPTARPATQAFLSRHVASGFVLWSISWHIFAPRRFVISLHPYTQRYHALDTARLSALYKDRRRPTTRSVVFQNVKGRLFCSRLIDGVGLKGAA
jgi:hypothetical protein